MRRPCGAGVLPPPHGGLRPEFPGIWDDFQSLGMIRYGAQTRFSVPILNLRVRAGTGGAQEL